jgi:hypothetical protein
MKKSCEIPYKIGILSMQKIVNHGSFLQAFALLQTIKKLRPSAEVLFIDIKPGIHLSGKLKMKIKNMKILKYIYRFLFGKFYRIKAQLIFNKCWRKFLGITRNHHWNTCFDTVVIGSDEVFNCLQECTWGFSKNLLGEGLNSNNIITYAASSGFTTVSKVETKSLSRDVEKAFKNIRHFSVRDENTLQFVKRFAYKDAFIHLDPVFLFNYDTYILAKKQESRNFVFIYSYENRINKKEEISAICDFAKNNNMEIICIEYQSWCKKNVIIEPFEVLDYFKQAAYVITDTFHGTVLSIKYNKQFVSFIRYEDPIFPNANKLHYLLKKFELQDREIKNAKELPQRIIQKINFESVNKILEEQTQKSFEYLDQYL